MKESDEVFFASNDGGPLGMSDLERNNKVFKIRLGDAKGDGVVNVPITEVSGFFFFLRSSGLIESCFFF